MDTQFLLPQSMYYNECMDLYLYLSLCNKNEEIMRRREKDQWKYKRANKREKIVVCEEASLQKCLRVLFMVCAYFQWEVMQGNRKVGIWNIKWWIVVWLEIISSCDYSSLETSVWICLKSLIKVIWCPSNVYLLISLYILHSTSIDSHLIN